MTAMPPTDDDGNCISLGQLPSVGAKFSLNGNKFRVNYVKDTKENFRFSADLIGKFNEGD